VLPHAIAVAADRHDVTVVDEPIDQRGGHDLVAKGMTSTNRSRNVTVGTTNRSAAMIWFAWFVRKVRHVCDGGGAPQSGFAVESSRMRPRISCGTVGRPVPGRLAGPEQTKAASVPAMTVSGFTMRTAQRQPRHDRESHAQSIRSTRVKRRRGRRDRSRTASWWRRAMISRCSETRDRATHRSEWSSETTTEATTGGYRTWAVTSIDAKRTELSATTGPSGADPIIPTSGQ
jgi:hypothetical protein